MTVASACVFIAIALRLAWCDLRDRVMPTGLLDLAIGLGLLASLWSLPSVELGFSSTLQESVIGMCCGYGGLWAMNSLYRAARGRDGIGYADLKLAAALGAWFGWLALPPMIAAAGVFAIGYGLLKSKLDEPLPFGTGLAIGGLGWLAWHTALDVAS